MLWLNGLKKLTDKQAEALWNVKDLSLNWLEKITDEQAKWLSKAKALYVNWLNSITDKQAEILSKVPYLFIKGSILTEKQKQILKNRVTWNDKAYTI